MQNSKMGDFKAEEFLSGNVTATDVDNLEKKELILVAKQLKEGLEVESKAKADMLLCCRHWQYVVC